MKKRFCSLRKYEPADAAAIAQLLNAVGKPFDLQRAVVDGAGQVRLRRYVPPSSQKVVAVDRQNQIVGYAYLADRDGRIVYETGGGAAGSDRPDRRPGEMILRPLWLAVWPHGRGSGNVGEFDFLVTTGRISR